jgi:hypothetical protein
MIDKVQGPGIVEQEAAVARQWRDKRVSVATDSDATIEDMVFSMWSLPYNDQQQLLSCIVSSHYLATTSEQTEDFMCAVVVVIHRMCKSVRLL